MWRFNMIVERIVLAFFVLLATVYGLMTFGSFGYVVQSYISDLL